MKLPYPIIAILILLAAILLPFFTAYIFNQDKDNLKQQFCKISKIWFKISFILTVITFTASSFINHDKLDDNFITNYIINDIYFLGLFLGFIMINYYATTSKIIKKNIIVFMESLDRFITEKGLFNLLILLSIIITESINKEVTLSLIGAYVFFALTETSNYYINNKDNTKIKTWEKIYQIVLNISALYFLVNFEIAINHRNNSEEIKLVNFIISGTIFVLFNIVIHNTDRILNNKFINFFKLK